MDAPVVVEHNLPNPLNSEHKAPNIEPNYNETGFPFDESDFEDTGRNASFRNTLNDIAQRYPEFAQHLDFDNRFPSRSRTWGHRRSRENPPPSNRFAEFSDHFGPFDLRSKDEFAFPFADSSDQEHFTRRPEQAPEEKTKPPQVPTSERGRKCNPNLPQSSTVDLGQKQEPIYETRGQRSMSAPPENRSGQRFVSSINIPMNTDGSKEPQTSHQQPQQQQQQSQSQQQQPQFKANERVIPIHVEGRDEPVLPKHTNQTFSQPPPQNDRMFGQQKQNFGQWKRSEPSYYMGGETYTNEPHYEGRHQFFTGHPQQQRTNTEQFPNTGAFNKQPQQPPTPPTAQQQKSATPPPQPQQQPPPSGPISQIQCIQRDVLELMGHVEQFNGLPKDKQYLYLDEMLTRNLLKLDNIETEGKENIRHARKEAINCIQKCISILEAKALANEQLRKVMDVDTKTGEDTSLTALEVSGISRSGTENISSSQEQNNEVQDETFIEAAPKEESAEAQIKETEVAASEKSDVEMKDKEDTPKAECEIVEDKPKEEIVESSQEAPKVTKDKKKVKKKEKAAE